MGAIFRASVAALGAVLTIPIAATAADLSPLPQSAPVASAPFNFWTGFYFGGNIGAARADGRVTDSVFGLSSSTSPSVFIYGGQGGYNYQFSNFVIGIEADADWASLRGTGTAFPVTGVGTLQGSANTKWMSTLAARFGVAYGDVLFFGKAGGGWVGNTGSITNLTTAGVLSASNTSSGWLVGAGIEWAFWSSWSTKIEYDYLGLRSWTFASPAFLGGDTFTVNRNLQMLKIGLNYRLDWGRSVATHY
jgi:outer membrane immunogenic protein